MAEQTRLRRMTGNGLMLAAVLLGLLTAGVAFGWLNQVRADERAAASVAAGETRSVVVAHQDIAAGVRVTDAMVTHLDVPASLALAGAASEVREVTGHVTRYPISAGEQIVPSKLVVSGEKATATGLAYSVPPGMRAVSVPVSEVVAAGGLVVPGDRVDVMVSTDYGSLFGPFDQLARRADGADPGTHKVVVTTLQNVLVLAVGQVITPAADNERDAATLRVDGADPQPKASSVTVAVTPDDAQALFMATKSGTIGLALRPYGDTGRASLQPALSLTTRQSASPTLASSGN
ncbi:MAG: Flp pilus assembly protein CpaB [Dehalococcoidia bacterium]|nr:MAG: Flp pilus assembly protein CpaB [Dehalococcoidia bacterium]